jgi:hypothetical protein
VTVKKATTARQTRAFISFPFHGSDRVEQYGSTRQPWRLLQLEHTKMSACLLVYQAMRLLEDLEESLIP